MCTNPVNIKNVNYRYGHAQQYTLLGRFSGKEDLTEEQYQRRVHSRMLRNRELVAKSSVNQFSWAKDSAFSRSMVPCGCCDECLKLKQLQILQRCQVEFDSSYVYFFTLTYKPKYLPVYVSESSGESFSYADPDDIRKMLRAFRHYGNIPAFKQFVVSEYGGSKHRPHWHGLLFFKKEDVQNPDSLERRLTELLQRYWCRSLGKGRYAEHEQLCDFSARRYSHGKVEKPWDLHRVTKFISKSVSSDLFAPVDSHSDESSVMFYVSKYMLKPDEWLRKLQQYIRLNYESEEYKEIWKHRVRPHILISHFFGITDEVFDLIEHNLEAAQRYNQNTRSYPQFLLRGVKDGHSSPYWAPMCRYYRELRPRDTSVTDKVRPLRTGDYIFNAEWRRFYYDLRPDIQVVDDEFETGSVWITPRDEETLRALDVRSRRARELIQSHNGDYTFS